MTCSLDKSRGNLFSINCQAAYNLASFHQFNGIISIHLGPAACSPLLNSWGYPSPLFSCNSPVLRNTPRPNAAAKIAKTNKQFNYISIHKCHQYRCLINYLPTSAAGATCSWLNVTRRLAKPGCQIQRGVGLEASSSKDVLGLGDALFCWIPWTI